MSPRQKTRSNVPVNRSRPPPKREPSASKPRRRNKIVSWSERQPRSMSLSPNAICSPAKSMKSRPASNSKSHRLNYFSPKARCWNAVDSRFQPPLNRLPSEKRRSDFPWGKFIKKSFPERRMIFRPLLRFCFFGKLRLFSQLFVSALTRLFIRRSFSNERASSNRQIFPSLSAGFCHNAFSSDWKHRFSDNGADGDPLRHRQHRAPRRSPAYLVGRRSSSRLFFRTRFSQLHPDSCKQLSRTAGFDRFEKRCSRQAPEHVRPI